MFLTIIVCTDLQVNVDSIVAIMIVKFRTTCFCDIFIFIRVAMLCTDCSSFVHLLVRFEWIVLNYELHYEI